MRTRGEPWASALRVFVALPRLPADMTALVDDADKGRALGVCIGCVCRVATSPRGYRVATPLRGQDAFG
jgi:hypothetical protein